MTLPRFDFHDATSFEQAFELKARYGAEGRYFAGGTALMLLMRAELLQPVALIGIRGLPGTRALGLEDGFVRIGAALTHAELAASAVLRTHLPTVADTFRHVATRRVRNVATVGGNLAHANPHQDPPVTLTAFDARVVVRGPSGERRIPMEELFVDYFQTSLEAEEILTAIEIPLQAEGARSVFVKYLPRSADDYATVNVAVCLRCVDGRIAAPRIVVGSMGPTVICARDAEALLEDRTPDDDRIRAAGLASVVKADPEHDSRGTPEYKKRIAPAIVARAVRAAWEAAPVTPVGMA